MELQGAQQEAQRCPCSEHHRAAQPRHMPGGLGTTHHLRASRGGCHRSCKPPEASPRLVVCAKESLPSASLRVAAPKRSRPTIRSFPAPELQPITMRVDSHLTSHSGRTVHKESNRGRGKRSALPTRSRGRRGVAGTLCRSCSARRRSLASTRLYKKSRKEAHSADCVWERSHTRPGYKFQPRGRCKTRPVIDLLRFVFGLARRSRSPSRRTGRRDRASLTAAHRRQAEAYRARPVAASGSWPTSQRTGSRSLPIWSSPSATTRSSTLPPSGTGRTRTSSFTLMSCGPTSTIVTALMSGSSPRHSKHRHLN